MFQEKRIVFFAFIFALILHGIIFTFIPKKIDTPNTLMREEKFIIKSKMVKLAREEIKVENKPIENEPPKEKPPEEAVLDNRIEQNSLPQEIPAFTSVETAESERDIPENEVLVGETMDVPDIESPNLNVADSVSSGFNNISIVNSNGGSKNNENQAVTGTAVKTSEKPVSVPSTPVVSTKQQQSSESEIVNVGEPEVEYVILEKYLPKYPEGAKQFSIEATVVVKVTIGLNGRVERIDFINSVEEFGFNRSVRDALRHWRFIVKKNGKTVRGIAMFSFPFSYSN